MQNQVSTSRAQAPKRLRKHVSTRGFTMIELMVVVIIIISSLAFAVPSITRYTAQWKHTEATQTLARLFRQARSEAIAYGRASLVLVDRSGTSPTVEVWRGDFAFCRMNGWAGAALALDCSIDANCRGSWSAQHYEQGGNTITLANDPTSTAAGVVSYCYDSTGELLRIPSAGRSMTGSFTNNFARDAVVVQFSGRPDLGIILPGFGSAQVGF